MTEEAGRLYGELKKILNHTGMAEHHVWRKNFYADMDIVLAGCAHQAGTCRFGTDPATSVLDVNCKAHELDNLYVVDTSFFPTIGAVNPGPDRHGQRDPGRRAHSEPHRLSPPGGR
jgi:choline dehydrogenase-like flavoprotein